MWFSIFQSENSSLREALHFQGESDEVKKLVNETHHFTVREIMWIIFISETSVGRYLQKVGYVNKFDVWVPA